MKFSPKRMGVAFVAISAWFYLWNYLLRDGFQQFQQLYGSFSSVVIFSLFGVVLYALKKKPEANLHLVEALELLIIAMAPTAASFPIIAVSPLGKSLIAALLSSISVIWFVFFYFQDGTTDKEKQDIINSRRIILFIFIMLAILSVFAFAFVQYVSWFT